MNFYPFSLGFTAVFSLALGVFVVYKNPRSKINVLWGISCFFCAIWSACFVASFFVSTQSWGDFWSRAMNVSAAYIPVLMLHFCREITGIHREKKWPIRIAYVSAIAISLFGFTDFFLVAKPVLSFKYYAQARPGFFYFTAHFFVFALYSWYLLWRGMRQSIDPVKKNQIKYILLAFVIGYIAGSSAFLPVYGILVDPLLMHFVWLYAAMISYAIVKHRLMDIKVAIKRTVFYTFLTILVSSGYLFIVFAFYVFVLGNNATHSIPLNFIGIAFIAITFKPFEIMLNKFLDKKFFKGSIGEISAQKAILESELERTERLKSVGILAAGMAHEIKNPLTVIRTFAEYLPQKHEDPEFREKFSRLAIAETDRISALIQDLLLFAKPAAPVFERVDTAKLIREILELLSGDLVKNKISTKLILENETQKYFATADRSQMKQALLNILLNAIDAVKSQPSKEITLQIDEIEDSIKIRIQDTGIGIAPDKIEHLFDPFFTDKEGGNGLGLAITHSILRQNGGSIRVESSPGGGAVFCLTFRGK